MRGLFASVETLIEELVLKVVKKSNCEFSRSSTKIEVQEQRQLSLMLDNSALSTCFRKSKPLSFTKVQNKSEILQGPTDFDIRPVVGEVERLSQKVSNRRNETFKSCIVHFPLAVLVDSEDQVLSNPNTGQCVMNDGTLCNIPTRMEQSQTFMSSPSLTFVLFCDFLQNKNQ